MGRVPLVLSFGMLLLLAGFGASFGFWLRGRMVLEEKEDWRSMIARWEHPEGLPDLPLVDQDGAAFSLHELADHWVLVGFVFTRCERAEACPLTMQQMAAAQEAWRPEDPALTLLTLTIDPEFDTPPRLQAYGERFGRKPNGWRLATGDPELMKQGLPSLFNVLAIPSAEGFDHTVKLALLRPGLVLDRSWKDGAFTVESLREAVSSPLQ